MESSSEPLTDMAATLIRRRDKLRAREISLVREELMVREATLMHEHRHALLVGAWERLGAEEKRALEADVGMQQAMQALAALRHACEQMEALDRVLRMQLAAQLRRQQQQHQAFRHNCVAMMQDIREMFARDMEQDDETEPAARELQRRNRLAWQYAGQFLQDAHTFHLI